MCVYALVKPVWSPSTERNHYYETRKDQEPQILHSEVWDTLHMHIIHTVVMLTLNHIRIQHAYRVNLANLNPY